MGYWEQSSNGVSFASDPGITKESQRLIWGDAPADYMEHALECIKIAFMIDLGRLPSQAEIEAGIRFSLSGQDLPEQPDRAGSLTVDQRATVRKYAPLILGELGGVDLAKLRHARDKIQDVVDDVTE